MAKKFSNSDLFEADLFNEPINKARAFLDVIAQIEEASKQTIKGQASALKSFGKINSLDELRKTKKLIEEINVLTQRAEKLQLEKKKITEAINTEIKKGEVQEQKAMTEKERMNKVLLENEKKLMELRREKIRLAKDSINADLKNDQQRIRNQKELAALEMQQIKLKNQKEKEQSKKDKEERLLNAMKGQVKTIQQLQDRNNALIKVRKNLDLTTEEGVREYKKLTAEINKNNTALKQHDAAIGNMQRNVGNYGQALKGFGTQLLGVLGVGSFLSVVNNAVESNAKFGQSMADLKAITGATDEQMKFFKNSAIDQTKGLEGSTASATEYTEALKLIASAKPELLENNNALKQVTDQALLLADASGLELPDAATRLTDAMNQFGASSSQAGKFVDVLAAGAKYGSAEIPQITDALLEFGAVAKSSNVSIQESTALVEALAERGIKGSEAGNKLRNVLISLSAAKGLPKEALDSFERLGVNTDILSDNSLTLNQRLKELKKVSGDEVALLKIFGKENIVAAKTVLNQTDRIAELTVKVDENGVAQDQASERTGTLSGELKKLSNAWESAMIGFGQGGNQLAETVRFIRLNLDTIIATVIKLVRAFAVFKTVQATMKLGEIAAAGYSAAMKLFKKEVEGAEKGMKAMNGTMKANVIALVVVAVIELADALDLFTSKAEKAQQQLEKDIKYTQDNTDKKKKIFDKELEEAVKRGDTDYRLAQSRRATEEELTALKLKNLNDQKKIAEKYRGEEQDAWETYGEEIVERQVELDYLEQRLTEARGISTEEFKKLSKAQKDQWYRDYKDRTTTQERADVVDVSNRQAAAKNELALAEENFKIKEIAMNEYKNLIADLEVDMEVSTNETNNNITDSNKVATESQIAEAQRLKDEKIRLALDLKRMLEDLNAENIETEREQSIEKERLSFEREKESVLEKYDKLKKLNEQQTTQKNAILQALEVDHNQKLAEIRKRNDERELKDLFQWLEIVYKAKEKYLRENITDQKLLDEQLLDLKIKQANEELKILEGNAASEEEILEKQIELSGLLTTKRESNFDKQFDAFEHALTEEELALEQSSKTREEIEDELLKKKVETLENEIKLTKEAGKDAIDLELELAKLKRTIRDKELEEEKERNQDLIQASTLLADELAKSYIELSRKREEAFDKEIDASKKRQDELRTLADKGVLEAEQSIGAEERKQAELERKKLEEQKKQKRIELANTTFKAYAGHVDNNDKSPLSSTIRDITALMSFINSIPAFIEGTESVEKSLKPSLNTGQDDYLIRVDGKERIMNPSQNKHLNGLSNEEVVQIVRESKAVKGHSAGAVQNVKIADSFSASMRWQDNSQILSKFDELKNEIKNKPVQYIAIDEVRKEIVEQIKSGNRMITTHYKKSNLNA
jgi:TP901 family phage tail tape measure protein